MNSEQVLTSIAVDYLGLQYPENNVISTFDDVCRDKFPKLTEDDVKNAMMKYATGAINLKVAPFYHKLTIKGIFTILRESGVLKAKEPDKPQEREIDHNAKNRDIIPGFFWDCFKGNYTRLQLFAIGAIWGEIIGVEPAKPEEVVKFKSVADKMLDENHKVNLYLNDVQARWNKFCKNCDDPNGFIEDWINLKY